MRPKGLGGGLVFPARTSFHTRHVGERQGQGRSGQDVLRRQARRAGRQPRAGIRQAFARGGREGGPPEGPGRMRQSERVPPQAAAAQSESPLEGRDLGGGSGLGSHMQGGPAGDEEQHEGERVALLG